jgi:hypothetical protein
MERFRIVTTQGLSFQQLMKKNNVNPSGFISATDNVFTNQNWEITTTWESKKHFEESLNSPMKKWFWNRFETEAFKHEIKLLVIDGDTGEITEPLSFD